ncbi:MAG: acyltransferase family protein [Phycisphaerae bacterium]
MATKAHVFIPSPRSPALDILRAAAVLLVFGRHLMPLTNDGPHLIIRFAQTWRRAAIGTDIFFVLSGFLVSGLIFREYQRHHALNTRRFLVRRAFKIYPAYFFYLAASIPAAFLLGQDTPTTTQLAVHSILVQNYYPHYLEICAHLWSLGVEEHFYAAVAIAMFLAPKLSRSPQNPFRWIPLAFALAAVACLAARILLAIHHPFDFYRNYLPTHLRLDSLLFGVFLSYYFHFHHQDFTARAKKFKRPLLAAGLLGLLPAFCIGPEHPFSYTAGFTLYYLSTGALVSVAAVTPLSPQKPLARIATFLALRSYSIYLWHLLTFLLIRHLFINYAPNVGKIFFLNAAVTIAAALLLGTAMYTLIEQPALHLRDRLIPSPNRSQKQKEPLNPEALSTPIVAAS